jgi:RAB protein geranylgeranyltransferase component A
LKIEHRYFQVVKNHFLGDEQKTWQWLATKHPRLMNLSPMELIRKGQGKRLMKWIDDNFKGAHDKT